MTALHQKFMELFSTAKVIYYRVTPVAWQDGFTGEWSTHYVDFTIVGQDSTEHIEVLPASQQTPLTKYLYAQNNLPGWRMITKSELIAIGENDHNTPSWW